MAATVFVAGLGLLAVTANLLWKQIHRPFLETLRQVRPGVPEERVIELLGEPVHVHEGAEQGPDWYEVHSNVTHPRWRIERKVLIFHGPGDYIVYVHVGHDGRVKDVFVGGT